jgi:hypothetical protein
MPNLLTTPRGFLKFAPDRPFLVVLAFLVVLTGCGGNSGSSSSGPPSQISSVSVSPGSVSLVPGQGQSFLAQVQGTGAFSSSVTWSVNGVAGGNSTYGTITSTGQYAAPPKVPNPANVTVSAASLQDPTKSGNSTATILVPVVLNSITPTAAIAGEVVSVTATFNFDVIETPQVVFSGTNGTSISMPLQTGNGLTVQVPFGATSGPVYMSIPPQPGGVITISETSNSVQFTRLPNLQVRAPNKDLSSGESLQLAWRVLGASTPNVVTWTADSGSINAQGIFHAPTVSSESYSLVTGCISNTTACNAVLLRILPFRITPSNPIVKVGGTLQLNAVQGSSTLSPQWSILAGGGGISSSGLFTAPTSMAQAGPVIVSATVGSTTEQTSIAVSGAYAGQVNRVFDYADFTKNTRPEWAYVQSVTVSGNRAYALTIGGDPHQLNNSYEALDVFDITNPAQPVWIDAVESATNSPASLFTYGNALFSLDSDNLVVYSLQSQAPTLTQILPDPGVGTLSQNGPVLYTAPIQSTSITTTPIDLFDLSSGVAVHKHYELPNPPGVITVGPYAITGVGNTVYIPGYQSIFTYDISQTPPQLISTVSSTGTAFEPGTVFDLRVAGNLLFEESNVYDISNITPVPITTLPVQLEEGWGKQANDVLATFGAPAQGPPGYAVVDVSSPSNPTVRATVTDLQSWDIYNPGTATWAGSGIFYAADGTGGFSVYDVSVNGGPASLSEAGIFQSIYDQAIEGQTLYAAAVYGSGAGGVGCFDISQSPPAFLGALTYPNDPSFAIQVSGSNVFVGLADGLKVVDVSNPQSPSEIASTKIPVNALVLSGNTLFAGTSDGRLVVFDVSVPSAPNQVASVAMAAPNTMRLSGTLLLVAAGNSGLLIFDVSNPSAPAMLSQFSPSVSVPVWDVVPVGGSAIMLAADLSGIVTLDISNPSRPQQLYQQPLPYVTAFPNHLSTTGIISAISLAAQVGLTYVGTNYGVLVTYDPSIPAVPRLVGLNVPGYAGDFLPVITPNGNNLYLSDFGYVLQTDNTIPQNLIELYDPPAALSLASPVSSSAKKKAENRGPLRLWSQRQVRTNEQRTGPASVFHGKPTLHSSKQ